MFNLYKEEIIPNIKLFYSNACTKDLWLSFFEEFYVQVIIND